MATTDLNQKTFSETTALINNYNRWIMRVFGPYMRGDLLEVGIGHGGFPDMIPVECRYSGVDIEPALIQQAKKTNPMLDYYVGDISKPVVGLEGKSFDTVLCVNVVEHIPNDTAALNNMLSYLKPGGHMLVFVPAFQMLMNDLDRLAGHERRYTKETFKESLNAVEQPYQLLKLEYFNSVGAVGWFVNKFVKHESLDGEGVSGQMQFYDKYVLPIAKLANPLTKHIFGQSLIAVVKKGNSV